MADEIVPIGIVEASDIVNSDSHNFTSEEITRIQNSPDLSAEDVSEMITNIEGKLTEIQTTINAAYELIVEDLTLTESKRVYSGATAEEQRSTLEEIQTALADMLNDIYEMGDASVVAATYNTNMAQIRKGIKLKLLIAVADSINAAADSCQTTYLYESNTWSDIYEDLSLGGVSHFKNDVEAQFSVKNAEWTEKKDDGTGYPTYTKHYRCTTYNVAYLNYWSACGWGKGDGPKWYLPWTWGDDNVSEIESKISTINSRLTNNHIDLPY